MSHTSTNQPVGTLEVDSFARRPSIIIVPVSSPFLTHATCQQQQQLNININNNNNFD